MPKTRLNKYLAQAGVASRRRADELIVSGAVRVNGAVVRKLGVLVDVGDRVQVVDALVEPPARWTYLLLNKPPGIVTTMRDPQGRRTIADLIPKGVRVVPVGRLDYATTGVLLLTNDGELAQYLLHPRFGVEKTYRAVIDRRLQADDVRQLRRGIVLGDGRTTGAKVQVVGSTRDGSVVELTIHEGRNRQVRRMFEALGYRIGALTRTRFGPLRLGSLRAGQIRSLTSKERTELQRYRRPPAESPRTNPDTKISAK